ncbi:ABC transporter substrate-binding protein [Seonamhaeicola sp. MEBiC1930]|uniref:type IX secretion system anionic LPS delivery protein PorZ n=1 Tax=Seonamhaeicola sp. MEBiC01930 TaxID=2976768 RepID=UPI0032482B22
MHKNLIVLIGCIFSLFSFSQDFSTSWQGHFSYFDIKEVIQGGNKFYAASENALFSYNLNSNEIEEFDTVKGLSGESISTIYYSEDYELLVIGYENGLIEITFDNGDNVLSVVDIIEKPTITATNKRINHFNPYQNLIYISTNYGISVFDLEKLEFGDTYFIGDGGNQINVNQTSVFGDFIYAACSNGNGIKSAQVSNPNLIDFQNWQTLFTGTYSLIKAHNDKHYAINSNNRIYDITNNTLVELFTYSETPLDIKGYEQNIVVTTKNNVFVYDENFGLDFQVGIEFDFETEYNSAIINETDLYIGTKDFGVLKTDRDNSSLFEEIHPDGPLMNVPFSIEAESNGVWVTFGEYDEFYNPYPINSRGISHLKEDEWINTPYSEVLNANCLNAISVNPSNTSQVFISSFFNGLLEINDEIPTILYNEQNSGLESLIDPNDPNYIDVRVGESAFDNNGVLWVTSGLIENQLKSLNPSSNRWSSYSLNAVIPEAFDNNGFADITIDNNQTKWVAAGFSYGFIGFNESGGNIRVKGVYKDDQNMPSTTVSALAIDKRNQLWIGTYRGLRVLYNTSGFFEEDNVQVNEIIIEEDGIAKELLFQQLITDIKVDGSNNKWIGTADSGLFYFSSDGQNTIYHFTEDNSPLPSNTINDISLDNNNGRVYIATSRGLVSFLSGASRTFEDLTNAYAYPNPVRPGFNIITEKIKIKDISDNVNIKITDIEGNLVAEAQSNINNRHNGYNLEIDGGTAYWNGKNLGNNIVASGVYLVMLSDLDSFETKVLKLMVIR